MRVYFFSETCLCFLKILKKKKLKFCLNFDIFIIKVRILKEVRTQKKLLLNLLVNADLLPHNWVEKMF